MSNDAIGAESRKVIQDAVNTFQKKLDYFAPSAKYIEQWQMITDDAEKMRDDAESGTNVVHYHVSRKTFASIALGYGYLFLCVYVIINYLYGFVRAFLYGDSNAVEPSLGTILLFVGGIVVFAVLTVYDYWNAQLRVRAYVVVLTCVLGITIASVWYKLAYAIFVPLLLMPEPNEFVPGAKWMFLIRILTTFPTVILTFLCVKAFTDVIFEKFTLETIEEFRLTEHVDLRAGKKYKYDTTIINQKYNGMRFVITEAERFLHFIVNGSTGTGKSSMILERMVNEDLNKRCLNEDKMIKESKKLLKHKKAYLNRPIKGRYDFDLSALTPVDEKAAKKIEKIASRYKKIGYTVLCPDCSMTDHIAELCKAKGIDISLIDPEYDEKTGTFKHGTKGFNPLYISPSVPASERPSVIASRAVLVAEILTKLNALKGEGDPYFVGLNRTVTETIAITLLVTFPLKEGRQPNLVDVQLCINDFSRLEPYYEALQNINNNLDGYPYTFVCDFAKLHLLGEGRKDMISQAKGLQMLVNEFLTQDRIRFLLCAPDNATIDMDEMLAKGQITCINYGIRFGTIISTGFGLFVMLSFINATMRRPGNENTRIPHILMIDELARCLHPDLELEISLARKYRVSVVGAIQSLAQFGQSEATRYMEQVVLGGSAHHIVFGRCGTAEMELYEKLAGRGYEHKEMQTVSETSITTDDPHYSYSTRSELVEIDNLRATDITYKHFKECTVFTTKQNMRIHFFAKVNFLEKSDYNTLKREKVKWDELYAKFGAGSVTPDEKTMEVVEEKLEKQAAEYEDIDLTMPLFNDDGTVADFSASDEIGGTSVADDASDDEIAGNDEAPAKEEPAEVVSEVSEDKPSYTKLKPSYMKSDESGGVDLD